MASCSTRRIDNVDWRMAIYLLAIPILIFYAITLCGSLPGLQSTYLIQLTSSSVDISSTVRVGYFAVCAGVEKRYMCLPTTGRSVTSVTHRLASLAQADAADMDEDEYGRLQLLVQMALHLQTKQLLCLLAPAGCFFALSIVPFVLLKRDLKKKGNSNAASRRAQLKRASLMATWTSVGLATASAVAVAQSTSALDYATNDDFQTAVRMTPGMVLQAFQWTIVALSSIYSVGIMSILRITDGTVRSAGYRLGQGMPSTDPFDFGPPPPPPPP